MAIDSDAYMTNFDQSMLFKMVKYAKQIVEPSSHDFGNFDFIL